MTSEEERGRRIDGVRIPMDDVEQQGGEQTWKRGAAAGMESGEAGEQQRPNPNEGATGEVRRFLGKRGTKWVRTALIISK